MQLQWESARQFAAERKIILWTYFSFFHPSFHEKSIFFYFLFFFSSSVESCLLKFSWIKTCRPNLSWANQGMTLGRNRKPISLPSLTEAHVPVKRCKMLFRNLMFHNKNLNFFYFKLFFLFFYIILICWC
jgi:hypothetical protein